MSVGSAALHKAIAATWTEYVHRHYKLYWPTQESYFSSLNEEEGAPGQPFPYCVFTISAGRVISRMSAGQPPDCIGRREIVDYPVRFTTHARQWKDVLVNKSAKEIAAELVAHVMETFGGHPTEKAVDVAMDIGQILVIQYQTDFGAKTGDEEYSWAVDYIVRVDTPVAT